MPLPPVMAQSHKHWPGPAGPGRRGGSSDCPGQSRSDRVQAQAESDHDHHDDHQMMVMLMKQVLRTLNFLFRFVHSCVQPTDQATAGMPVQVVCRER